MEEPMPPHGSCNLGSLDLSKFVDQNDKKLDLDLLALAVKLGVRFLDATIDKNNFPSDEFRDWAMKNRPTGLSIMGLADMYLDLGIAYGSKDALELLEFIMSFIYKEAEDESIALGKEKGIPENCKVLPTPRRNITLLTIAPTGTVSLLAGCSSGIEPIFSEITIRNDKTGSYQLKNISTDLPHFRCAVSSNGAKEVTWEEHVRTLDSAQKFVDGAVSKTINFANHTHRDTIADSIMLAWKLGNIKGMTIYRNGSRKTEVLSPQLIKKDKCPVCKSDMAVNTDGSKKCSKCDFVLAPK